MVSNGRPTVTLGGHYLWTDVFRFPGWRIQENPVSKRCRLLDDWERCHRVGSETDCLEHFNRLRGTAGWTVPEKPAVVLLHGICRDRLSMTWMARRLQSVGYQTYCLGYASTRAPIEDHAVALHRVVSRLENATRIHFVVHSMGGLVVRRYLQDHQDPRLGRLVMLGTPNLGAEKADRLHQWRLFQGLFGAAGRQLCTPAVDGGISAKLPNRAMMETGVVAGARGDGNGWSTMIPGDDDGTVTVASTRLPGSADF
ncbi:MAG: esterase/lipase family protein, partial [Planctomycetia bacterium]